MNQPDYAVEFNHVSKVFGNNTVINDISLKIQKSHFVTFLGPSGCGKTTLLRMLAGFYETDAGHININGRDVTHEPPYKRNTAMVFQEYALFPHMTVFGNVAYGLKERGFPKEEIESKVKEVLEMMQLRNMEKRYPNQLSGGQQQRVAVARALVMNPDALLLDEPLSNLDAKLREAVRVELRLIQRKLNLTVIYVTHDQQEALAMSDCVVVLDKGTIKQVGSPYEIYYKPKSRFIADFIGITNTIDVTLIDKDQLKYGDYIIPVEIVTEEMSVNDNIYACIRPEKIQLTVTPDDQKGHIPATVQLVQFLGEKTRYFVDDQYGKSWIIDIAARYIDHQMGDKVYLNIAADAPHLVNE